MDDLVLREGTKNLKVSIAGLDSESRTTTADAIRVTLYAFDEGPPVKSLFTFQLDLESATRLFGYLDGVSLIREEGRRISGRFVELNKSVPREVVEAFLNHPDLLGDPDVVRSVLSLNPELCRVIIETELDALDVQGLAYRRSQLETMGTLLEGGDAFDRYREIHEISQKGQEPSWQHFFQRNQWIFGFALNYVIGEGVDPEKLEQVVSGHSIGGAGKRVDALLKTRGVLQSLCYVEIKTAETPLVHSTEYRPDVWRPSKELGGAIAQSQKTVQKAIENLRDRLEVAHELGAGSDVLFNYTPRSVVVCGSLTEFADAGSADASKFSSFELFRRGLISPDIITFDEVYNRALAVVEAGLAAHDARVQQATEEERSSQ